MKSEILLLILIFNGILFAIFFTSDGGFVFSFLAGLIVSAILFPIIAIEYLLFDYLFGLSQKKEKLTDSHI